MQGSIDWIASQGFLEGPYSIIVAHKDQLSMKLLGPSCTMLALTFYYEYHTHTVIMLSWLQTALDYSTINSAKILLNKC